MQQTWRTHRNTVSSAHIVNTVSTAFGEEQAQANTANMVELEKEIHLFCNIQCSQLEYR